MHGPACTTVTGTIVPFSSYTRVIPTFRPRIAAIDPLPFSLMAFLAPHWPPKTRFPPATEVSGFTAISRPALPIARRRQLQNQDPYSAIVVSRPLMQPSLTEGAAGK